jgi:hypothetical protein
LRRALFLAMARELGWVSFSDLDPTRLGSQVVLTNRMGVDLVDLRPAANRVSSPENPPEAQVADTAAPGNSSGSPPATTGNAIPAFVSGDTMILAIDASVAPAGSAVTFWSGTPGQQQPIGSTVVGANPAAVTIPFVARAANGWNVTVIAAPPGGSSNVIGQFAIPPTSQP